MTLSRRARSPKVRVNSATPNPIFRPLSIQRSAGGGQVDTATFFYDLGAAGERLMDGKVPTAHDQSVSVIDQQADTLDFDTDRPLFGGKISAQRLRLGPKPEQAIVVARLERFHFGTPLLGMPFQPPGNTVTKLYHTPFTFNPEVRGIVEANMSEADDPTFGFRLFLDPDSRRTEGASDTWAQSWSKWTLANAVYTLCWLLNGPEEYVSNPASVAELEAILGTDPELLKNHRIDYGLYLPEALDALLTPYEFGWYAKPTIFDEDGQVLPVLTFYKKNAGTQVDVKFQRPGDRLDLAEHNVSGFDLEVELSSTTNEVVARTSRRRREATIELYKTWAEVDDDIDIDELVEGGPEYEARPHVWRKWAANEDGSYTSLGRPEVPTPFNDLDLPIFDGVDAVYPRRRKLMPALTLQDGAPKGPGGVVVEWEREPGDWVRLPPNPEEVEGDWAYNVLEYELGIVFIGKLPPEPLHAQGAAARIRVTGTIEADKAYETVAAKVATSPLNDTHVLFLDLASDFHDTLRRGDSALNEISTVDESDDKAALDAYAAVVKDRRDVARIVGQIVLEGADHPEYEIGQVVTKVAGREISLNARSAASPLAPLYPEIVAIRLDYQPKQLTTLFLGAPPGRLPPVQKRPPEPETEFV